MDQRRAIFQDNLALIRARNYQFDRGQSSYELGVNCYGDMR